MRRFWTLLVALMLCCTAASAAVLPVDAKTFPAFTDKNGTIHLEWGGPVLPAWTEYELLETVVTDVNCVIGQCEEPFHKFAHIAFMDEKGQPQDAWGMAYELNRAMPADLAGDEKGAVAYAQRFFSNQYVLACEENADVEVTAGENVWNAVLKNEQGAITHTLRFDTAGRIISYQDEQFSPPGLAGGTEHSDELGAQAASCGAIGMLEWMSRELLPNVGFNSIATFAYDETAKVYSFAIDSTDFIVSVALEPELHIVAYADMDMPQTSYGDYLSLEAAEERGRALLAETCGLTEEEAAACTLNQSEFCMQQGDWSDEDTPLPYWYLWFITAPGENYAEYDIMIDAATGDSLYAGGPITGNG